MEPSLAFVDSSRLWHLRSCFALDFPCAFDTHFWGYLPTIESLTKTKMKIKSHVLISSHIACSLNFIMPLVTILSPGGVLDFGLDGGVPPGPQDPNPCLEVKKVPMFRDFAQKMDPCLGIF